MLPRQVGILALFLCRIPQSLDALRENERRAQWLFKRSVKTSTLPPSSREGGTADDAEQGTDALRGA